MGSTFQSVRHINRALPADWNRRLPAGETIIFLGNLAHADTGRDERGLRLDVAG